ncbi:hypothetical protein SAMN05216456_0411 [Devosia crocina]|uniref:Uncharacterized protein n=1 Tax=Devosia crocina TaxID=429728 RepID=A0A1I7N045_9HYPH|nr:hypothetical protein [Devosia crocina]SFV27998.1 hypothetical protein SAMN05216456_0411 [Devosia crocina]
MNKSGVPTGEGTSAENDVADPHPSTEEDYDKIPHPGGEHPPKDKGFGGNSYLHDGDAPSVGNSKVEPNGPQ